MRPLEGRQQSLGLSAAPEERVWPLIVKHHTTGMDVLRVDPAQTREITGTTPERGEELKRIAFGYLYDLAYVYRHQWSENEFVIWDNWTVQHAREPFDQSEHRCMVRSVIADPDDARAVEPGGVLVGGQAGAMS